MLLHRSWLLLAGIVSIYFALTFARALTAQPWNDEAWYTAPSLNLIVHGNTGTPYLETTHKFWKGIDKRTYWVVPLQFFAQVPWIKVFGFSLVKMRSFAIFWGLVAMLSWGLTVWKLTGQRMAAAAAMLFIACDYQFDSQVSLARMDAMALGLSSLAIACYVELRERNFSLAMITSQAGVVGCGLTHPTAGVPAFTGVLFLIIYLDWRKIRFRHILPAAAPYLAGAVFWGWYISEAPDLFRAQFLGNVTDIDRLGGFSHPLRAIWRECMRYWHMAGFAAGLNSLYKAKIIVIGVYLVSALYFVFNKPARRKPGVGILLGLWLTYFVTMTFYENTKEVKYAIHIVCLYDVLLSLFVSALWNGSRIRKSIAVALSAAFVSVSVGGLLYAAILKDDVHNAYLPAARFLEKNAAQGDLILAGSEFGFALGFNRNIVDDGDFTFYSRKQPKYILIGNADRVRLAHLEEIHPEVYQYFETMIAAKYDQVYSRGEYAIFERSKTGPLDAGLAR